MVRHYILQTDYDYYKSIKKHYTIPLTDRSISYIIKILISHKVEIFDYVSKLVILMVRKLLDSEWTILRAMWGKKPQTMHEIIVSVQAAKPETDWQYKTYHSYLRIMVDKGLIGYEEKNRRDKLYFPVITREQALKSESETLLSRISEDSMGSLVVMMAESGRLTAKDRKELLELAERLERESVSNCG